jgi:hypothetical protein
MRQILHLDLTNEFDENSPRPQVDVTNLDGAGAFHLAAEIGPWTEKSPRLLID